MGIPFHETVRGAKFFDRDFPRAVKALETIAKHLDDMAKERAEQAKQTEETKPCEKGETDA